MNARIADLDVDTKVKLAALMGAPKEMLLSVFRQDIFWPRIQRQDTDYLQEFCKEVGGYLAPYGLLAKAVGEMMHEQPVSLAQLAEIHTLLEGDSRVQDTYRR